jgi:single-strand DNA-binding protein
MNGYNKVILIGNLTRDPEVRYTPKGLAVAQTALAINRKWKAADGEEKEDVTFVEFTAFGRQAEVLGQYKKKGEPLMVDGRLQLEQWDDKQTGQKRSKLKVVVESILFLSSGDRSEQQAEGSPRRAAPARAEARTLTPATQSPTTDEAPKDGEDDDLPF